MYFKHLPSVRMTAKDGFEDLTHSVFKTIFSSYEDLIREHSDSSYDLIIPDITIDTLKHVVNLITRGFTITSTQNEVKDIQDISIMLNITSLQTNLLVKKYQSMDASSTG